MSNNCTKIIQFASRVVGHNELTRPCIHLPNGWCARYEGGGPIGVDSSAHRAFYAPAGYQDGKYEQTIPQGFASRHVGGEYPNMQYAHGPWVVCVPVPFVEVPAEIIADFDRQGLPVSYNTYFTG